jgi:hypothetical protein
MLVALIAYLNWPESTPGEPSATAGFSLEGLASVPAYAVNKPRAVPAREARLADQDEVIGVSVAGKHRAYPVRALSGSISIHVVNDLIDGHPVSVTHCDRNSCTKVFQGKTRNVLLDLYSSGWYQDQMMICAGDSVYFQVTGRPVHQSFPPFPYAELPFEVTTWKAWREAHPDTEVCIGITKPVRRPPKESSKIPG